MPETALAARRPNPHRLSPAEQEAIIARCRALRSERERRHLYQSSLAAIVGMQRSHLHKFERGQLDPHLSTYFAVRTVVLGRDLALLGRLGARDLARQQVIEWVAAAKAARVQRGLHLCDIGTVDERQVRRVEAGTEIPRLSTALRIAEVVGVDV